MILSIRFIIKLGNNIFHKTCNNLNCLKDIVRITLYVRGEEMNYRQAILLKGLIYNQKLNLETWMDTFGVSERTIRNDLEYIEKILWDSELKISIEYHGRNVDLEASNEELNRFLRYIDEENDIKYQFSPEERKKYILIELLFSKDFVTLDDLADRAKVSRGTIIADIKEIKKWLKVDQIRLEGSAHKGMKIEGPEETKRELIVSLIKDFQHQQIGMVQFAKDDSILGKVFREIDLRLIKKIICEAEDFFGHTLTDIAFDSLLIHIGVSILRLESGHEIVFDQELYAEIKDEKVFLMARYIAQLIESELDITLPEEELGYITLHLIGKNDMQGETKLYEKWLNIQIVSSELIKNVGNELKIDFKDDDRLYEGLIKHINTAIYRIKNHMILRNPLLKEILENYFEIYQAVVTHISPIEKFVDTTITDDEIAYLVMHFGASVERKRQVLLIPKVLIVCSTGMGTAQVVLQRLNQHFHLHIVGVIGFHELTKYESGSELDLIITTVPIKSKFPSIRVSPFLTDENVTDLKRYFNHNRMNCNLEKGEQQSLEISDALEKLYCLADECINKELKNRMKFELNKVDRYFVKRHKKEAQPLLSEVLTESKVKLKVECDNWREAVQSAGELLYEADCVTKEYIDEMIQSVIDLGPYVVITKHVAIPHARPEKGAKRIGISLVSLKNPVNFGNKENDPVKYVFGLSAVDAKTHMKALSELVELLEVDEFYRAIDLAHSPSEVFKYIVKFEERKEGIR